MTTAGLNSGRSRTNRVEFPETDVKRVRGMTKGQILVSESPRGRLKDVGSERQVAEEWRSERQGHG